jgi:hypothetical protein
MMSIDEFASTTPVTKRLKQTNKTLVSQEMNLIHTFCLAFIFFVF